MLGNPIKYIYIYNDRKTKAKKREYQLDEEEVGATRIEKMEQGDSIPIGRHRAREIERETMREK